MAFAWRERRWRFVRWTAGVMLYESDIKPHDRFLMERFIAAPLEVRGEGAAKAGYTEFVNPKVRPSSFAPALAYVSLDIETDAFEGDILSIALCRQGRETILLRGEAALWQTDLPVRWFRDEHALLAGFPSTRKDLDPDLILACSPAHGGQE